MRKLGDNLIENPQELADVYTRWLVIPSLLPVRFETANVPRINLPENVVSGANKPNGRLDLDVGISD